MTKNSEKKSDNPEKGEREKALELALIQIEKQFGKGAVMRLGEKQAITPVDVIPTGALSLDIALGVGGIPRGRIIEIYGPESSGKTTLSLQISANVQKLGGIVAYIDVEHALDTVYAQTLGVNVDELLISQPDSAEQALEIVETLVRSGAVDLVVVDSVAALVPRAEVEGEIGESHMGLQARLMSQALRKLAGATAKSKTAVIFINQLREKIGIVFGNPEVTPGGRALKFYAAVRIDIRKESSIKKGDEIIGSVVKAKIAKNKVAPPFRLATFEMYFNRGIDRESSILDTALNYNYIERTGTWYVYKGERIGQGRVNAVQYLKEHPEIAEKIEKEIRESLIGKTI